MTNRVVRPSFVAYGQLITLSQIKTSACVWGRWWWLGVRVHVRVYEQFHGVLMCLLYCLLQNSVYGKFCVIEPLK